MPDWEKLGAVNGMAPWFGALWLIIYSHGIGWIVTALTALVIGRTSGAIGSGIRQIIGIIAG